MDTKIEQQLSTAFSDYIKSIEPMLGRSLILDETVMLHDAWLEGVKYSAMITNESLKKLLLPEPQTFWDRIRKVMGI